MKNKIIGIFVGILFIVPSISAGIQADDAYNPLDGGWVEERDGVTILHVSGTYYEMGYQHGYLLKDKIEQVYRTIFALNETGDLYDVILNDWWYNWYKQYTPECYIEEMQGLADGSGKPLEDVIVIAIAGAFYLTEEQCMEMAAWGSATKDGKLRHFYSMDISLQAKDPETGVYLTENQIIMVRDPLEGCSSMQPYFPGTFIGSGINENHIAMSCDSSPSSEWTEYNGTYPFHFRLVNVLDNADTLNEAVDIMTSHRNGGANYIISDGKIPMSYVCEETVNYSYVGTWDDETESNGPFWSIENVVRRKNMYLNPITAKTQRLIYDPRIHVFLGILGSPWFNTWSYYKTLSQEIEKQWGSLNSTNILSITRSIYRGETNVYLKISEMLGLEGFSSCYQWVACPETGDMLISFADRNHPAQYNTIHEFNLFNLLDSQPP